MPDLVIPCAVVIWALTLLSVRWGAYRLGVHDGWRAHMRPRDTLWNKQRKIVREYGEDAPDA